MSVQISITSPPDDGDLRALAHAIGRELPRDYLDFVQAHDGSKPQSNMVALADNKSGVRRFIPVSEATTLRCKIDGFPKNVVPLADDDCGNYFYLDPESGGVHFWDHEIEGDDELVSSSLNGFLEKLSPFDASQVKLAAGQVKRVWINSSFKPEF